MGSQQGVWGVLWGAEGALGSGVRVLAVGLEGADREQLRRMVTSEDPRYIYHGGGALAELEQELTDDLCTIISTRVRGRVPWELGKGSSPAGAGVFSYLQVHTGFPCLASRSWRRSPAPCSAPR